jgi:hypothetical protein
MPVRLRGVAPNYSLRIHHIDPFLQRKRELLLENWGVLSRIAKRLGNTPQFVRDVFWGRRRSARMERVLRRRGLWIPIAHNSRVRRRRRKRNV